MNEEAKKSDKFKVIVVDDDQLICQLIKKFLEVGGKYEVLWFTDPKLGLASIEKNIPDIVLLDIRMPGMSGLEMLEKLKQNHFTSHIPVVIITGDERQPTIDTALNGYAEAYIIKPIMQVPLEKKVSSILNARKKIA